MRPSCCEAAARSFSAMPFSASVLLDLRRPRRRPPPPANWSCSLIILPAAAAAAAAAAGTADADAAAGTLTTSKRAARLSSRTSSPTARPAATDGTRWPTIGRCAAGGTTPFHTALVRPAGTFSSSSPLSPSCSFSARPSQCSPLAIADNPAMPGGGWLTR